MYEYLLHFEKSKILTAALLTGLRCLPPRLARGRGRYGYQPPPSLNLHQGFPIMLLIVESLGSFTRSLTESPCFSPKSKPSNFRIRGEGKAFVQRITCRQPVRNPVPRPSRPEGGAPRPGCGYSGVLKSPSTCRARIGVRNRTARYSGRLKPIHPLAQPEGPTFQTRL